MDEYHGRSILIAATNHEGILDVAIWRRFEESLRFDLPSHEQLRQLLVLKLRGVRREFDLDDSELPGLLNGLSHADVERVLRRAIKAMILGAHEFLALRHIEDAIRRERPRLSQRGT